LATKKIVPKTTNYKLIIDDKQVQEIIKNTPKEQVESVIDRLTREYLRKRYPDRLIEGLERVGKVTEVWYTYD